jgi:hypothetical protein
VKQEAILDDTLK